MAGYSQTTLVRRIRDRLGETAWYDALTAAQNSTTNTTMTVADTTRWAVNDIMEMQDDGERMLVTAIASGTTLTVIRGFLSDTVNTGTTHANGTYVAKRPIFPMNLIKDAITAVIDELWPWVYTTDITDITPSTTSGGYYSMPATTEDISMIWQQDTNTTSPGIYSYGGRRSNYPVWLYNGLANNVPVTGTTGRVLFLPVHRNFTKTIHVVGIRRLTDTVATGTYSDLPTSGIEISTVLNLAVAELSEATDIGRAENRDNAMYDQTVPVLTQSKVGAIWRQKGMRYRHQWERELRAQYPRMRVFVDANADPQGWRRLG